MQNGRKFHWLFKPWGTNHTGTILTTFFAWINVKCCKSRQGQICSKDCRAEVPHQKKGSLYFIHWDKFLGTQIQCLCAEQYRVDPGGAKANSLGKKTLGNESGSSSSSLKPHCEKENKAEPNSRVHRRAAIRTCKILRYSLLSSLSHVSHK